MAQRRVAVAWFSPQSFAEAKWRGAEDLPAEFEDWRAAAEREIAELRSKGVEVAKVDLAPAELSAWCRDNNRPIDAAARVIFAAITLIEREQGRPAPF